MMLEDFEYGFSKIIEACKFSKNLIIEFAIVGPFVDAYGDT